MRVEERILEGEEERGVKERRKRGKRGGEYGRR